MASFRNPYTFTSFFSLMLREFLTLIPLYCLQLCLAKVESALKLKIKALESKPMCYKENIGNINISNIFISIKLSI